jgi:hypothetical protein
MGVAMRPQGVHAWVGDFDFGDFFTGEVSGQASLPVLVGAFDFAFGLGGGGIEETDVVKLECPAQLGQGVRIVSEKEAVVIDVDLERASGRPEGGGQEVEVGEQEFPLLNFCAGEQAAAIIEQIEHGEGGPGVRKPAVRRGVELPEFADLRALPAADGRQNFFGRDRMGETVFERPAADLGAVELEGVQGGAPRQPRSCKDTAASRPGVSGAGPERAVARRSNGRHRQCRASRAVAAGGRARGCKRWPARKGGWARGRVGRRPGRH